MGPMAFAAPRVGVGGIPPAPCSARFRVAEGQTVKVPSWEIEGIVQESRILRSQKNDKWRGYVVRLAAIGGTYEINVDSCVPKGTDDATFEKTYAVGTPLRAAGRFEAQGYGVRLLASAASPVK